MCVHHYSCIVSYSLHYWSRYQKGTAGNTQRPLTQEAQDTRPHNLRNSEYSSADNKIHSCVLIASHVAQDTQMMSIVLESSMCHRSTLSATYFSFELCHTSAVRDVILMNTLETTNLIV